MHATQLFTLTSGWITPKEQYDRLRKPIEERAEAIQALVQEYLIPSVANRINEYEKDKVALYWYEAMILLGVVPEKIPPLRGDIYEILDRPCPVYGNAYRMGETHVLTLYLQEYESLNTFEKILKEYEKNNYLEEETPLQIRWFWNQARIQYGDAPFPQTFWGLQLKGVLPESKNKYWCAQESLPRQHSVVHHISTLQQVYTAMAIYKIATGESLFPEGEPRGMQGSATRVQETCAGARLTIGCSNSRGILIEGYYDNIALPTVGVTAICRYSLSES